MEFAGRHSVVGLVAHARDHASGLAGLEEVHVLEEAVGLKRRRLFEHVVGLHTHGAVAAFGQRLCVALFEGLRHGVLHPAFGVAQVTDQGGRGNPRQLGFGFEQH